MKQFILCTERATRRMSSRVGGKGVSVCVCVCEREREKTKTKTHKDVENNCSFAYPHFKHS